MQVQIKAEGLYGLFLRRINEVKREVKKEVIPFNSLYEKLCRNFSITKSECRELLYLVRDFGMIEIVPCHGVRINEYLKFNN